MSGELPSLPVLHLFDWSHSASLRDKLFPALGFGGKIGAQVSHEFALNGNPQNPYCVGIPGVVEAYHTALRSVKLWGPTNFAPIIDHVARFAQQATTQPQVQVRLNTTKHFMRQGLGQPSVSLSLQVILLLSFPAILYTSDAD